MEKNISNISFLVVLVFTLYIWLFVGEKDNSYKIIKPVNYDLVIKNGLIYDVDGNFNVQKILDPEGFKKICEEKYKEWFNKIKSKLTLLFLSFFIVYF